MKIETKISVGETFWVMYQNTACSYELISMYINVNSSGKVSVTYISENRQFDECYCFKTKQELLNSL